MQFLIAKSGFIFFKSRNCIIQIFAIYRKGNILCTCTSDRLQNNININMISTSEIRVTVLINEKDGVRAMNAVHDAFNLAD